MRRVRVTTGLYMWSWMANTAGRTSTTRVQVKTVSSCFNVQHRKLTYERSQVSMSPKILSVVTANLVQHSHSRKPFRRLVSLLASISKCLTSSTSESPAPLDGPSDGMMEEGISVHVQEESHGKGRQCEPCFQFVPTAADRATSARVTICVLPDDLLLGIFDLHREEITCRYPVKSAWEWTTLAHVCRRWRAIILVSPRRLHLRVICRLTTPVRKSLDIWPPLPLAIICFPYHTLDEKGEDSLAAALEYRDRISDIHIVDPEGSSVQRLVVAMQESLPVLTTLYLGSFFQGPLVLPDTFLGGYAPRLTSLSLHHVSFSAFPIFVLRATRIVTLRLFEIPPSEYNSISPDVMTTCLAALPYLGTLSIEFQYAPTSPVPTTLPPPTRTVLPTLADFRFRGVVEYLEDFIARIDTPLLNELRISFSMDLNFHTPQLHQFISRTQGLRSLNHARVKLFDYLVKVALGSPTRFELEIGCGAPERQLSSLTQICNVHFPFLSQVDRLDISWASGLELEQMNEVGPSQWVELFRPFSGVRSLYVSTTPGPLVATALGELTGERTMEVLPALELLFLDEFELPGSARDAMGTFIAARQLSDRPVVVQRQEGQSRPMSSTSYSSEDEV